MFFAGIMVLLTLAFGHTSAYASEVNFSVRAMLPENQMTHDVSYFYLNTQPGQKQALSVSIHNRGDEDILVGVQASTAFTNANGAIDYSGRIPDGKKPAIDFLSLIAIDDPNVLVRAGQTATAEILLKMPDDPFDGEVLGGLIFTELPSEETSDPQENPTVSGMSIQHVFNYCIAVRLVQGDFASLAPEFVLESAEIGEKAGFPSLIVNIRNQSRLVAKDATLWIHVYAQDQTEVLSFLSQKVSMAPDSTMPYSVYLQDGSPLSAGTYRVCAALYLEEKTWDFETLLTID